MQALAAYASRHEIELTQLAKLRSLLSAVVPANPFYAAKFSAHETVATVDNLHDFQQRFPFTLKSELMADQLAHPPFGTNLTFPLHDYRRCHQTSGTHGAPMRWLDTRESWEWLLDCWEQVYRAAGVTANDRIFFAFSFGPFLGFWTAFEAALRLGCFCFPGGGMSTAARWQTIRDLGVSVLCCTPTYALRLAEAAGKGSGPSPSSRVRLLIVAGEPGGSLPAVRRRLSEGWSGARVFDHHGMTEVGPVSYECPVRPGILHVIETGYIAEIIEPGSERAVLPGQTGELVLTTLGRVGSPLIRYRTGDLVKGMASTSACICGQYNLGLEMGILGRTDDMVFVRGVNVYPGAVDEIIRQFLQITEYQVMINPTADLTELTVNLESSPDCSNPGDLARQLEEAFHAALNLRVPVVVLPTGSLPRHEMKASRWIKIEGIE